MPEHPDLYSALSFENLQLRAVNLFLDERIRPHLLAIARQGFLNRSMTPWKEITDELDAAAFAYGLYAVRDAHNIDEVKLFPLAKTDPCVNERFFKALIRRCPDNSQNTDEPIPVSHISLEQRRRLSTYLGNWELMLQSLLRVPTQVHVSGMEGYRGIESRVLGPHEIESVGVLQTPAAVVGTSNSGPIEASVDVRDDSTYLSDCSAPNIFRRTNDTWEVRFQGGQLQKGLDLRKAAEDVRFIIENCKSRVAVWHLPGNRGAIDCETSHQVATQADCWILSSQIHDLKAKLERETDGLKRIDLQDESEALEKQFTQNCNLRGQPRELEGSLEKVLKSTQRRVNRLKNKLRHANLIELAEHFDKYLKIGLECRYDLKCDVTWSTE